MCSINFVMIYSMRVIRNIPNTEFEKSYQMKNKILFPIFIVWLFFGLRKDESMS